MNLLLEQTIKWKYNFRHQKQETRKKCEKITWKTRNCDIQRIDRAALERDAVDNEYIKAIKYWLNENANNNKNNTAN